MTAHPFGVGPIEVFMTHDHVRLDDLLETACEGAGPIDLATYGVFRHDLLRHIAMEEKVLLPYAREKLGAPLTTARALRADHGKIAKLLVRTPTHEIVASLRELLVEHNPLEEGADGLYAQCDRLAGDEADDVVARLREVPHVPVAPYFDGPTGGSRKGAASCDP